MSLFKRPTLSVSLFFGTLLLLGLFLFRDYGVSWDEPIDRLNGQVSGRYAAQLLAPEWLRQHPRLQQVPLLENFSENDHGVLFEMPVALLDQVLFAADNPQGYYYLRHLLVFLVSTAGVWALYRLGRHRFDSWQWGLLGALLLVLSPRFFAESFYNAKDWFSRLCSRWPCTRWCACSSALARGVL